jgi:hypothetical protein
MFGLIFTPTFYVLCRGVTDEDGIPARIGRRLGFGRKPAEPEGPAGPEAPKPAE